MSLIRALSQAAKITRHSNAVAAGTTTITPSSGIDMQGYDGCLFLVAFGAITASGVQSVKVQQSDDDGVSDAYSDLEGTSVSVADDDDNQLVWVDVARPQKRYLKVIVSRATQNSAIDGILALQYGSKVEPVTHDSTTVLGGELHVSPDEGTA